MRPQRPQKIDLDADYPCPCRRHGRLGKITLTEAFGCDRCQHIFVVRDDGQAIEQLSSTYPYKRVWRWVGQRWLPAHPAWSEGYLPAALGAFVVASVLCLPLLLKSAAPMLMIFLVILLFFLLVAVLWRAWFGYRR